MNAVQEFAKKYIEVYSNVIAQGATVEEAHKVTTEFMIAGFAKAGA